MMLLSRMATAARMGYLLGGDKLCRGSVIFLNETGLVFMKKTVHCTHWGYDRI